MQKQPKEWEETMTPKEVEWCLWHLNYEASSGFYDKIDREYYHCYNHVSNFRAARAWKSSQVRRFKKARGCCGSHEWVKYRWNWRKFRFDKYLLGFNYGH